MGSWAAGPVDQPVPQGGHPGAASASMLGQASLSAAPRPTMPATFSVPARLAALLCAAVDQVRQRGCPCGHRGRPRPWGRGIYGPERESRSMFMRLHVDGHDGPPPAPRRCGTARPASRQMAPISAMGWMVPISLLANMIGDQGGVRPDGRLAPASGSTRPFAVHREVGDLKALLLQPLCRCAARRGAQPPR